ncbi:AIM24 family protein [Mycobacterium sp. ITM-2016-00316]|uniref:AIM24 family protein n=1 Tax=Mycobacterium sp. ITM-2016-00316 TaxID=2099695 RepID=UPI000CF88A3F|nr:AIM24 family protein [Mycobacterium sp. ITM-2016-00316]WNG80644.1 AIM24 family protein [Mycobacterium sp. ITM-2016-00316]
MSGQWLRDPEGRFEYRWYDGQNWTDQVSHQGQVHTAPLGAPPAQAAQQHEHQGAPQAAQHHEPQAPQPQHQGDGFAGISGDLIDGRFSEKESTAIALQNERLLRVRLGEPFMARQGSMVAYQGNVDFAFEGGGAGKFLKKALTGEGLPLMRCQGQGDVFLAEQANYVHLLQLTNSGLSISGKNVLAFSASLDWNIERVKGGSIATGGLFNTTLRGSGWVALTTDGPPVVLNAAEAPTFADTNAVVAWSANLQTQLKTSFKAGALIGRGSGEAVQVAFHGQGFVIVQPSEGITYPVQ